MRSYQTCGSIDKFSNSSIQDSVAGREFTAVIPSTPYAPFTYPKGYVAACLPPATSLFLLLLLNTEAGSKSDFAQAAAGHIV